MNYKEEITKYIEAHAEEMVADTMELCRINSVRGAYEEGKPYGEGPCKALHKAMEICERYGFSVRNYDNYVVTADMGDKEKCLDILAHMDVVAPGDGWSVTEPFAPVVKDGKIYGRGTSDDKGPAMAALFAMRAVKELGIPLSKNCRLILGSDEECGSSDIKHYYAVEKEAPMTFSPDGEFPVVNVEKGQFRGDIEAAFAASEGALRLLSLSGGDTTNIVPGKAEAILAGDIDDNLVRDLGKEVTEETGVQFTVSGHAEGLRIFAEGQGAHASTPEAGRNAALALLKLVAKLPLTDCRQTELLKKLSLRFPFGDHVGEALGIKMHDEVAGDTTVSLNILKVDETSLYAKFDSRTSIAANEENTVAKAKENLEQDGFSFSSTYVAPHAVPGDSYFVKTLLEAYEDVTGLKGRCLSMGGGTYVHDLKNGVAFGAVGEFTDPHMHGADEFMVIEELKQAAVIFALSIAELCK